MSARSKPPRSHWFAFCGTVMLMLTLAGSLRAQPAAADEVSPLDVSRWNVHYVDAYIGPRTASASVDWRLREAELLIHQAGGPPRVVRTRRVDAPSRDEGVARIEFVFPTPAPGGRAGGPAGRELIVNADASRGTFGIAARTEVREARLVLELAGDAEGGLGGRWSYAADPVTLWPREIVGRMGTMTQTPASADFTGRMSGAEVWVRAQTEIHHVVVLEDEPALEEGAALYPFHADERPGFGLDPRDTGRKRDGVNPRRRTLLVAGRSLPFANYPDNGPRAVAPAGEAISYVAQGRPIRLNQPGTERWWKRLAAGRDAATAAELRQLEAIEITAYFPPRTMPGVKEFEWAGERSKWVLNYGDNTALVQFVRPHRVGQETKWEATGQVFFPEEIAIEVRTQVALPVEKLRVRLAIGADAVVEREAARIGGAGATVWRTAPFLLVKRGGAVPAGAVAAAIDDKILAGVDPASVIFITGAQGSAVVASAPGSLAAVSDPWAPRRAPTALSWLQALVIAAKKPAAGATPAAVRELATGVSETFTNRFLFGPEGLAWLAKVSPEKVETAITVGEHAAMLMLRDVLIDELNRRIVDLEAVKMDATLTEGFANDAAATVQRAPESVLARLDAGRLGPNPVRYGEAFNQEKVRKALGDDESAARKWRLDATRRAIAAYQQAMRDSVATAAGIGDHEIRKLLKLTGRGCEPILQLVTNRLMVRDEQRGRWVPDDVARGFVDGIAARYGELMAIEHAKDEQFKFLVSVVAVLVVAPYATAEGLTARLVTAAANGIPWSVDGAYRFSELYETKAEVRFAFGASPVLGEERYGAALAEDRSWWEAIAISALEGVAAFGPDGWAAIKKFDADRVIARGRLLFEQSEAGVAGFRSLPPGQRDDFLAFLRDARARRKVGEKLTAVQDEALASWEDMAAVMGRGTTGRARPLPALSAEAFEKLRTTASQRLIEIKQLGTEISGRLATAEQAWKTAAASAAGAEPMAKRAAKWAAADAKAAFNDLESRAALLAQQSAAMRRNLFSAPPITPADLAWLSGRQARPDPAVVEAILTRYQRNWGEIKSAFTHGEIPPAQMHQFVTARREGVNARLKEVIADEEKAAAAALRAELDRAAKLEQEEALRQAAESTATGKPVPRRAPARRRAATPKEMHDRQLDFDAFGSTNLTSDYDISVKGEGAERIVAEFNRRFRAAHGGLESGFVLDTNVYTDPVYKIFHRSTLTGRTMNLANQELDTLRQLFFDQMATRKYTRNAAEWLAHKQRMVASADADTKAMFASVFEEVEHAEEAARQALAKHLPAGLAADAVKDGSNELLAATNRSYEDVLRDIDGWRRERARLDRIMAGEAEDLADNPDLLARYPGWDRGLKEIRQAKAEGNAERVRQLGAQWQERQAYQMRRKQGEALYYASEAYQTEATILHVVKELQAEGHKITLSKLLGKPRPSTISAAGSLNSLLENRANMFKELDHVRKADGTLKDADKAAAKCAKYFIRILDAAHQAGITLQKLATRELLERTIEVDARRGDFSQVGKYLLGKATSGKDFVAAVEQAANGLSSAVAQHEDIRSLARNLRPLFGEIGTAPQAADRGVEAVKGR